MQIKLDRRALATLINSDPEFKLDLQRSVMSEAIRNLFLNDVKPLVETLKPTLLGELVDAIRDDEVIKARLDEKLKGLVQSVRATSYSHAIQRQLTPETQEMINNRVQILLMEQMEKLDATVPTITERALERLTRYVDERLPNEVESRIDRAVARKIDEAVTARLEAIVAAASKEV